MTAATALERVHYAPGQILSAADFQAEQDYLLARLRRHNRFLHGWGVVQGLAVVLQGTDQVVVAPGFAVDCAGNEILVDAPHTLPIPPGAPLQFVVVRYAEMPVAPAPVLPIPGAETDALVFTRVREGFEFAIVALDPSAGHRGAGPRTPGCGMAHGLCIARLQHGPRGWKVARRGH